MYLQVLPGLDSQGSAEEAADTEQERVPGLQVEAAAGTVVQEQEQVPQEQAVQGPVLQGQERRAADIGQVPGEPVQVP